MTEADLYAFIATHSLGALGTTCHVDTPQSALVGIAVNQQLEIIFDTVKSSRKYPNLIADPAVLSLSAVGERASKPSDTRARRRNSLEAN